MSTQYCATHILQCFLLIARILTGQARQGIGDDVTMMQPLHRWITLHIQPEAMDELNIISLQCRDVGADMEGLCLAIRSDHKKSELSLWIREILPGLSHVEGLVLGSHAAGETRNYGVRFERSSSLHQGGKD